MALSQGMHQKQAQTGALTLTPQLRQAIKILQLSNQELSAYLTQEILDNPLLEMASAEERSPENSDHDASQEESPREEEPFLETEGEAYENLWTNESEADRWQGGATGAPVSPSNSFENRVAAAPVTLRDHLISQLHTDFSDPVDRIIGTYLIDSLDENGYLSIPLSEVSDKLGCSQTRVCATLQALQKCDPAGVFAENLVDCLRLQLIDQDALTHELATLLEHLPLFAEGKLEQLQKVAGLTRDQLVENLHLIQGLNPRPGLLYEAPAQEHVQPDVLVHWQEATQAWLIHLNEATLPKVLIDTGYYARVSREGEKEVKAYLKERFKSANWLVKALDQRAQTILKVSSEIVKRQGDFLKHGLGYLKPMTLKDIADAVDLHESTVSRVTQHKYMMTSRGIFGMKIFFSSSVASMTDEETHSSSRVQHMIQALVDSESPTAPYSDDQLVQALAEKGIDVARRTISKYRSIIGVPSSYERKKRYLRQL